MVNKIFIVNVMAWQSLVSALLCSLVSRNCCKSHLRCNDRKTVPLWVIDTWSCSLKRYGYVTLHQMTDRAGFPARNQPFAGLPSSYLLRHHSVIYHSTFSIRGFQRHLLPSYYIIHWLKCLRCHVELDIRDTIVIAFLVSCCLLLDRQM